MTAAAAPGASLTTLDPDTRALVRLAAVVAAGDDQTIRASLGAITAPPAWVDELLLQTYLFAGFPRALNAMRAWRRASGRAPSASDADAIPAAERRARGEATCRRVYGDMYEKLRTNIRDLHPALDDWMVEEGYGKVLSRPALDLPRRELCIVAACAASGQERQLLSHLHGSLNVGVAPAVVGAAIDALGDVLGEDRWRVARMLWARVGGDVRPWVQGRRT